MAGTTAARVAHCKRAVVLNTGREEPLQLLRREIQALVRIRHPGVERILDEGVHHGQPWYAMELVEGATLREHVHGLRPPAPGWLGAVLTVVRRLCEEGGTRLDASTVVTADSWEPMLAAAGTSLAATDAVLGGLA